MEYILQSSVPGLRAICCIHSSISYFVAAAVAVNSREEFTGTHSSGIGCIMTGKLWWHGAADHMATRVRKQGADHCD